LADIKREFWKQKIDRAGEPPRQPGPIQLQRYLATPPYSGIPTFMGVPVCLTQEDLKAGKVDVAIVGGTGRHVRWPARRRVRPTVHPGR
jgi:agmatinase